jgi:D-alanine-D-alanine ligase
MDRAQLKSLNIAVLLGGLSAEREVSLETGAAVDEALARRGYRTVRIDADRALPGRLLEAKAAVAFIALHGRYGEDGCVQGLLESMAIPYTGSGVLASALAMDKVQSKRLFQAEGLPTAEWRYPATREAVLSLGLPAVVKPRREGSSVGLTVVREEQQIERALEQAGGPAQALAERYISGREIAVGVLGSRDGARCLGSVEIRPADGLYDYEAKYKRDDTQYLAPAPVPDGVQRRLAELALLVHRLIDCAGATRTDFIWDGLSEPRVLEINTIPGMTGHSLLPKIAALSGMDYDDLVEAMLEGAALRA